MRAHNLARVDQETKVNLPSSESARKVFRMGFVSEIEWQVAVMREHLEREISNASTSSGALGNSVRWVSV